MVSFKVSFMVSFMVSFKVSFMVSLMVRISFLVNERVSISHPVFKFVDKLQDGSRCTV